ncbi:hypothetical protein ACT3CD_05510 [Geofilum sp. OHC36d9]|uniref:hypothetical protein n=1 Tax=Geofilum sp. OHC36d9 TaxID=3458413 RepID=UPI004033EEB3
MYLNLKTEFAVIRNYALIAMFFAACSSDDDDKINLDPNVSDSEVEDISGGVYFSSSLAGEYIFRINLKNGDDAITCDMFHYDEYIELSSAETTWQPGEILNNLKFSNSTNDIKLILFLDEDGEGEAQIFVENEEFEVVLFKSTSKQPVKIYTGLSISK